MTTQLLEGPQTGTGEPGGLSAEKPAPLYPACKKLAAALADYQDAAGSLDECLGKASKAEADMVMLGEGTLSEAESLKAISDAHGRKELYASRTLVQERKVEGLLAELRRSLVAANREVIGLVIPELERRQAVITKRVHEALGGIVDHMIVARSSIATVVRQSKLIWAVERLRPTPLYNAESLPAGDAVATAEALLKTLELLSPELGRAI